MKKTRAIFSYKIRMPRGKFPFVVLIFVALLLAANLLVSNILATSGSQLRKLQMRKENLVDQNARLRGEIVARKSLSSLEAKALELGFVKSSHSMSIASEPRVAMRQP